MERVVKKFAVLRNALDTLRDAISLFHEYADADKKNPTPRNEKIALAMRDSMIQRFEYCTDLFWKVLKNYLEQVEKVDVGIVSPRSVVRAAVAARVITDSEGTRCMAMVKSRNETSHIYHEELASEIAQEVPGYYDLLVAILSRIEKKSI